VSIRRKLQILALAGGSALATLGIGALPSASADECTVTVTLATGKQMTFTVNAPAGTPASSLVPSGTGPVKNVQASCAAATTTTATTTTTTTSATTTTTTTSSKPPAKNHGGGSGHHSSSHRSSGGKHNGHSSKPGAGNKKPGQKNGGSGTKKTGPNSKKSSSKSKSKSKSKKTKSASTTAPPGSSSAPFTIPGSSPFGVPNFFIDSFQIPPFLLPIYQAAGIEYNVPWQILAAINEIETDYGRNLSVSSAGAVGWMQFLPSTWKRYGMDVTGTGYADPYNPVDAIFAAARYLHAAGGSKDISKAIYSYNHASWYVQSVELRAKLIGGMPNDLIGTLTGLVEGRFPVAAPSKYGDSAVTKVANQHVKSGNAAIAVHSNPTSSATNIFAKAGSPVIAVNDGKVIKIGHSQQWGSYLQLQDSTGNIYTYTNLGSVSRTYPVPKPVSVTRAQIAQQLAIPTTQSSKSGPSSSTAPTAPAPNGPATAGSQGKPAASAHSAKVSSHPSFTLPGTSAKSGSGSASSSSSSKSSSSSSSPASSGSQASTSNSASDTGSASSTIPAPMPKERLFAYPHRPASWAAGGDLQVKNDASTTLSSFNNYFANVLHLGKNQYTLKPLKAGATVVAGTILGRIGKAPAGGLGPHLRFMIRPAGKNAPYIDPKPILDGWKLLAQTNVYRAEGMNPFSRAKKPATVGQILLMSKEQLAFRVLTDPHVGVYACGRRDIEAGLIDRRVLAVIEFLSASKLFPTVSGLECGNNKTASTGVDAAGATGASVDFSAINNTPILHHQGAGSITDTTIRQLLTLQGVFQPNAIVSTMSYKGHTNTVSMKDHANRVQVTYTPLFGQNSKLSTQLATLLKPGQWIQLINRINQIPEPIVPIAPSKYAIKVRTSGAVP
jgi:Transglycosylase SLT domain/Peptidase family M23